MSSQKLEVYFVEDKQTNQESNFKKLEVKDSIAAVREAQNRLTRLHQEGFLTASIDSLQVDGDRFYFHLNKGRQYRWAKLRPGNVNEEVLSKIGFRDKLYFNRLFEPEQFSNLMENLLNHYENNGYPFAEIGLDSVSFEDNGITAKLDLKKNVLLKVDSIIIKGDPPINDKYIYSSLDIYPNDRYNHARLMQVSNRILEIPFLKESKAYEIQYFENKTKLVLYLEKNQASSFNGIIGASTDEETQQIRLTGDVDLNLINAFHKGENIRFKWRSLTEQSQDLKFKFHYPYLLGTPLGFDFDFKLYKKDTTFINLETVVGVRYLLKSNDYIKLFLQNKNSNLLSKQNYISNTFSNLPTYTDSEVNLYGIEYSIERLDYIYNPTQGFSVLANFAFGTKEINKVPEIEQKNPKIYEGLKLRSQQYNGSSMFQYFFRIAQRSTVLFANESAVIFNENLFRNELLRIGGLQTLRGFDEESIYASAYSIATLEYRFLLDRNSFISVFSDAAYYENNSSDNYVKDWPIGVGAGISFETAAGIFTLNYALGKQMNNPFYLRSGKIHFGFINFF